jgi:hypothetical protein
VSATGTETQIGNFKKDAAPLPANKQMPPQANKLTTTFCKNGMPLSMPP